MGKSERQGEATQTQNRRTALVAHFGRFAKATGRISNEPRGKLVYLLPPLNHLLISLLKFDTALLSENLPLTKRHAVIVRVGEKQILRGTIEKLQGMQQTLRANVEQDKGKKRKGGVAAGDKVERSKKAKR
jgi:hypothetical protein